VVPEPEAEQVKVFLAGKLKLSVKIELSEILRLVQVGV
jgi:hypothetical protein